MHIFYPVTKYFHSFYILQELEQELQSMLDRTKVKEKDSRYGPVLMNEMAIGIRHL